MRCAVGSSRECCKHLPRISAPLLEPRKAQGFLSAPGARSCPLPASSQHPAACKPPCSTTAETVRVRAAPITQRGLSSAMPPALPRPSCSSHAELHGWELVPKQLCLMPPVRSAVPGQRCSLQILEEKLLVFDLLVSFSLIASTRLQRQEEKGVTVGNFCSLVCYNWPNLAPDGF